MNSLFRSVFFAMAVLFCLPNWTNAQIVYQGKEGPGAGKHIVFLAGDHEYRSEETLPALARILAKHHGFKCTVLFNVDKETGEIVPGNNNMPGLEALKSADLMVNFLRFQNFPDHQMQHIAEYLDRSGPVVGLRTASHAFKIPKNRKFAKYSFRFDGNDYKGGFGRQVLGETWAGHYGRNHVMSTRLDIVQKAKSHPILQGVQNPWVQAGGYWSNPMPDSEVLATAQPLASMKPNAPAAEGKKPCPGVWVRTYQGKPDGEKGRVFTTLYGASEDLNNPGFRRMLVNGCFWAIGLEKAIKANLNIDFVGPYNPSRFAFHGYRTKVKPAELSGFDSPIMPTDKPFATKPKKKKKNKKAKRTKKQQNKNQLVSVALKVPPKKAKPFTFQKNDVVAIYGNGLADRMQHDPWVETYLQNQFPELNLRIRNMSFSGDTVDRRPRSKGFINDLQYINQVKPDAIFFFYGYNESFGGEEKAEVYSQKLAALVEKYRAASKKNGKDPRFVLFSPIAYEQTGNPNLPDGIELNRNLAIYTDATKAAAENSGANFVDLFSTSKKIFQQSKEQLTLNGIHLNNAGYKKLASVISQLFASGDETNNTTDANSRLKGVYQAVEDKNWHWHNRFRATDGNDIWGSRSTLTFVDGQSNADVLVHELKMLDVMTANRDKVIWSAVAGKKIAADDSNVPKPVEVKSNVGGKSKSSSAMKEGDMNYLSPEESLKKIKVPEGFQLNVFASEEMFPDLANPVQMQVDSKGRLWAASWNSYPKWEPLKGMNDSLMIFEDTDNDGVADKRKIFAKVHNPLGFEFWGGGVLVTSGPDLIFLKDTDGDDKADVRYPILQGLGTSDTHHAANNLIFGPDGGIYWQSGVFLVHNHETPWKQSLNTGASGMYRFDPRTFAITPIAANNPNPHGTAFDYWGYCYANDGTGGKSYQVRPEGNGFKMHSLLKKEFRPVPANEILSSAHFTEDMQDDFLICNVIGFLGIKQYDLDRDGDGGKRKLGQVWGTPVKNLLDSSDRNFRPCDAIVGEDGALYVADWHNMIIGHMQHNIRDPSRDHKHGRILRLTMKDRPLQKPVKIAGQPIAQLLENLKHPVNGVRHRTRVELSARETKEVIAAVEKWVAQFDVNNEKEAHHALEGLWVYQQHHVRNEALLQKLLGSSVPHAVMAAKTVDHFWNKVDLKGASRFAAKAEETFVKFRPPNWLSKKDKKIYRRGAKIFQRESHCATCHQTNGEGNGVVYPPLVGSPWVLGSKERLIKLSLHGMWGKLTVGGKIFDPNKGVPPMTAFKDLLKDDEMAAVLTFVRNTWGNRADPVRPKLVAKVRAATKKRTTFWNPKDLTDQHPLEAELVANEKKIEVFSNVKLEQALLKADPADLARRALAKGNFKRGKNLFYKSAASCFACHDPPAGGLRTGPDLKTVKTKMSHVELVEALLKPSKKIDQDFAQVTVLTMEGKTVTGFRVEENEKEIVLLQSGESKPITLLKDDIDDMVDSKVSMMPEGLVRQLRIRQEFDDLLRYIIEVRNRK